MIIRLHFIISWLYFVVALLCHIIFCHDTLPSVAMSRAVSFPFLFPHFASLCRVPASAAALPSARASRAQFKFLKINKNFVFHIRWSDARDASAAVWTKAEAQARAKEKEENKQKNVGETKDSFFFSKTRRWCEKKEYFSFNRARARIL